jgi:hypothetical protein
MQLKRTFTVACLFISAALAQSAEDGLISTIRTIRYAPLAESARIQGDVHLSLDDGVVTVLSGHPLLAAIAVRSAKSLG